MRILRLGVVSFGKLIGHIMACIGFFFGVLYSFGGLIVDAFVNQQLNLGTLMAMMALIGMPFIFALFGFVCGVLGALIYNHLGNKVSLVELNVECL